MKQPISKELLEEAKRLRKIYEKRPPHSGEYYEQDENFIPTERVMREMEKYYPEDYERFMKMMKEHQDKIRKKIRIKNFQD